MATPSFLDAFVKTTSLNHVLLQCFFENVLRSEDIFLSLYIEHLQFNCKKVIILRRLITYIDNYIFA